MAYSLNIRGCLKTWSEPQVMGIVNLTPDSFFGGSRVRGVRAVLKRTEKMLEEGMEILDIGAMSSRPGAKLISEEDEWARLEKPLKAIVKQFPELLVSVDTFRSEVAERCVEAGAGIINDISGGSFDPKMFATVGRLQVPYILMHLSSPLQAWEKSGARPEKPAELSLIPYFSEKILQARAAGIHDIILDPGFGFDKTLEQNYAVLNHLRDLSIFDMPVLAGLSRKSMLYKPLGTTPEGALNATTAVNMVALLNGAAILRVHDVKEAVECVKIYRQLWTL
ncbi:dihydropteroate synthase [bacterium]|nr:dihydropteroate synthase [bacterium]